MRKPAISILCVGPLESLAKSRTLNMQVSEINELPNNPCKHALNMPSDVKITSPTAALHVLRRLNTVLRLRVLKRAVSLHICHTYLCRHIYQPYLFGRKSSSDQFLLSSAAGSE